ncbi:hypothetical protein N5P37_009173 [Trichoderma harzianum]|nr:hypothetical protein N5P37_009173 [Trichoderma harzianum]
MNPVQPTPPPPELIKGSLASGEGILCLGLPRSGTLSIVTALRQLGYSHVHHGAEQVFDSTNWEASIRASRACFPVWNVGGNQGSSSFSKADWDAFLGHYQVVSDFAGFYGSHIAKVYPTAKVILVQRPFESWYASLMPQYYRHSSNQSRLIAPVTGITAFTAHPYIVFGSFKAHNVDETRLNARAVYDEHYAAVRKIVPPENLLELNLEDGWAPLCNFLGKEIPDTPFPHVNDRKNMLTMCLDIGFRSKASQFPAYLS